jgi:hypothetical protein
MLALLIIINKASIYYLIIIILYLHYYFTVRYCQLLSLHRLMVENELRVWTNGGIRKREENQSNWRKMSQSHFIHHKSNMNFPWDETQASAVTG